MTTPTHSHKVWTDKGGHVTSTGSLGSGGWRVSGDLLDCLAATDRLHGDPGLELEAVGAALAHWWEPRSVAVPFLRV